MKRIGIILIAILAIVQAAIAAPKEGKVKYGKNIYFSGMVEKNMPAGLGALYIKLDKDSSPEIINGNFRDNIIDDGSVRMSLVSGDIAMIEGRFIFVAPQEKDADSFELILERGSIKVGNETYAVPTNISFMVAPDEIIGVAYRSQDPFYTTVRKKGSSAVAYGLVKAAGSDFGAQLSRLDSLRVGNEMYYPQESGLWRNWLNRTDYIDSRREVDGTFTPVAIHRINPFDGGVVDSDTPGSIYEDQLYTGKIVYPDASSFEGTFRYRITVDVNYVDGTFTGNDVVDTWKEGLNLTEIERERLRKIERIRQEIATLVAQADTTASTFVGRKYVGIKDADQISYQGTPAWIMHLDYITFNTKTKAVVSTDKVLIYAIDQATGGLGEILYNQDASEGTENSYIEDKGKIYLWAGAAVPENWEAFTEILSGYDVALRSERNNTRYVYIDEANDTLTKEVCRKVGVPYVSKAEADLATAEAKNI